MNRFLVILSFIFLSTAFGQGTYTVHFHVDKVSIKQKARKDSTFFKKEKNEALKQFRLIGYTGLSISDSVVKKSVIHYYFDYIHHFEKVVLTCVNANPKKKAKIYETNDFQGVLTRIDKQIKQLENNGFPFAAIKIIEQKEQEKKLFLNYEIDSGDFFVMDEIYIKCKGNVHDKTIMNLINIKPGDPYSEQKIRDIEVILPGTRLYKLLRPPQLIFKNGRVDLYLFIEKSRSSNADGYVGFQQDQVTGRLALNGYINLKLLNSLNRAETINLNWRNNPDKTQNLFAHFEYPFIIGLPVGIGTRIDLKKQDSTFIKSDVFLNITYHHPRFDFSLFDQIERSDIIRDSAPTGFRDYRKNTVGAEFIYRPKMPQYLKFYHPSIELMGGFFNYRSDTIDNNKQKVNNNKYRWKLNQTFDFLKYFHFHNSLSFEGLSSSIDLSRNELLFFGGLKSVRGFYELELFGNDVWILNNSLEFRPVNVLSFSLIYDYSIFNNIGRHYTHSGGFGFGFFADNYNLEIIVANGILDDNPLDFRNTKVHIGFTSRF